jgi:hypothetical protein
MKRTTAVIYRDIARLFDELAGNSEREEPERDEAARPKRPGANRRTTTLHTTSAAVTPTDLDRERALRTIRKHGRFVPLMPVKR